MYIQNITTNYFKTYLRNISTFPIAYVKNIHIRNYISLKNYRNLQFIFSTSITSEFSTLTVVSRIE